MASRYVFSLDAVIKLKVNMKYLECVHGYVNDRFRNLS